MNAKQELRMRLQQIINEHLGVQEDEIDEKSTWAQLGADSLDRLQISLAIEDAFKVDIPHMVGERLNTVGQTLDHLSDLISARSETAHIRIEAVNTNQQWVEMSGIRAQVFTTECGFPFTPLPGPGTEGTWHFLARDNGDAIGALSVVDTTGDIQLHKRYRLRFEKNDRVARYVQLAILKPYRKRGIFKKLIEAAQSSVIRPNGFGVGWLLYPAEYAHSSMLTRSLGFKPEAPLLTTEFGRCHVLVRRESCIPQVNGTEDSYPAIESCSIW